MTFKVHIAFAFAAFLSKPNIWMPELKEQFLLFLSKFAKEKRRWNLI